MSQLDPLTLDFIPSATVEPVIVVKKDDTLATAITQMELYNFSQLPVVTRSNTVVGVISWEDIGRGLAKDNRQESVTGLRRLDFPKANLQTSLIDVIGQINEFGYLIVLTNQNKLSGIITSSDLGEVLAGLAKPFLLIERLEVLLREILGFLMQEERIDIDAVLELLPASSRDKDIDRNKAEQYTLGELTQIISHKEVWPLLDTRHAQSIVVAAMSNAVDYRNQLMHFQPLTPTNVATAEMLPQLVEMLTDLVSNNLRDND